MIKMLKHYSDIRAKHKIKIARHLLSLHSWTKVKSTRSCIKSTSEEQCQNPGIHLDQTSLVKKRLIIDIKHRKYQASDDHHSLAPLYSQTYDTNPSKVYTNLFSENLGIVDYRGTLIKIKILQYSTLFPKVQKFTNQVRFWLNLIVLSSSLVKILTASLRILKDLQGPAKDP